jgi:hypothetical protein
MQTQSGIRRRLLHLPPQQAQQRRFPPPLRPIIATRSPLRRRASPAVNRAGNPGAGDRQLLHLQQTVGPQGVAVERQTPRRTGGQLGLTLFQARDLFFHLFGFAGQIFVVVDLPQVASRLALAVTRSISLCSALWRSASLSSVPPAPDAPRCREEERRAGSVAQDPTGISYSIQ